MNSNMRGKMGGIGRGRKPIAQENTPAPGGSIPPAQQNGFGSHRREFGEQNGPSSDRFERPQNDRFGSSAGGGFGGRGGFGGDDNSSQSKFGGGGGGSGFGESNRGFGSSDRNNDGGGFGGGRGGGRGGGGGGRGCHKCGEEGHFARECTNEGGGQGSGGFGGGGGGFGGNRGFGGGSNNDDGGRSGGGFGGGSFGGDRGGSNFGGDRGGSNFGGGGRGGDAGDRPRGCFNCGEEGHRKSECTQPMKERAGGGGGGGCFNCGVDGHRAADCTEPRKPREGEDGERKIANYEPKDLTGDDLFRYGRYDTGINFEHYDDIEVKVNIGGKSTAPKPIQSFQDVDMDDQILRSISRVGYKKPTPFQKSFQDVDMDDQILRNISRVGYKKPTPFQKSFQDMDGQILRNISRVGYKKPTPIQKSFQDMDGQILRNISRVGYKKPTPIQKSFQDMDGQILRNISRVGYKKPTPIQKSFQDMDMDGQILRNISRVGYKKPTPIQKYAIPIILEGHDVMACAQTGSGKTAAFLLPIFAKMYHNPQELRNASGSTRQAPTVLIISPTRELADQTYQECQKLGNETEIKPIRMYGQIRMDVQSRYLMSGCNVVCGCSGRIMDMLKRGLMTLENCRYLVLDEADKMLDMGFENDIRSIAQQYDMPSKEERQTLMFSATFPDQIQQMAKEFLKDRYAFITVGVIGAANTDITQSVIDITSTSKPKMDILKEMLLAEMQEKGAPSRTLVFVERKRNADVVAVYLSDAQIKAVSVHGDRYQKERQEAVDMFKSGDCVVLVATDVAARGLDIPNVEHVINFDLPKEEEVYVHRIGRTGRLGNPGRATSFYNDGENANFRTWLVHAMSEANQTVPEFLQENQSISSRFGETSSFAPPGNSFGGGFASAGSGFASDGASGFGGGFGDSANSKGWD